MTGLVDAITSETGVIAAIVVLIGLVVATQTLLRPWLTDWREARAARPVLVVSALDLSDLKAYSASRELRFTVGNSRGGEAVMTALLLRVVDEGPSEVPRPTQTAAPINIYEHRVELKPGKTEFDIRQRAFGPAAPPLKYAQASVDAFIVTLVSRQPRWYRVRVDAVWYDVKDPTNERISSSAETVADFPPSIPAGAHH